MYQSQSFRTSHFGQSGIVLRARGTELLSPEAIRQHAPSVFAEDKHASRSEKYTFIPTFDLFEQMAKEGFLPAEVRQGGSKDEGKLAYTKHLIRFRQRGAVPMVGGDCFPELILINSHDGTSSYQLMSGWFRLVCSNGLVVSETAGPSIKVSHRGNVDDVIEASYKVVQEFPEQAEHIQDMRHVQLTGPEQQAFATAAASLRFEAGQVAPASILIPRRREDADTSLWSTFNRAQENLVRGGIRTERIGPHGRRQRRRAREVNGISDNVRLNQALWMLAEEMRKIKTV